MQNILQGGEIVGELPAKCVDTGMGLERITAVLQGVHNNYDIDTFQGIISKAAELAGCEVRENAKGGAKYHVLKTISRNRNQIHGQVKLAEVSLRVIADHLRSMCFMLVDGVMPSNEGRGYVLRRIMRQAMRHVHLLGVSEPFIYKLVPTLVANMGEAYPELSRGQQMVTDVIKIEEERFGRTLSQGLKILNEESAKLKEGNKLAGEVAFKLYDTYGFPADLTQDALREHNIGVDMAGFETCMAEQRARARAAHKGSGDTKVSEVWFDLKDRLPATEFIGYENTRTDAQLMAIVKDGKEVTKAKKGEKVVLVFNQTPFYGESGGQVADTGTATFDSGKAEITDCQKLFDGYFFQHIATIVDGEITLEQVATLAIDAERRQRIRNNHSATHLMHAALRDVLGDHVFQKGSVVTADKLRFDFSQPKALTGEEILKIEDAVNRMIWANGQVTTKLMEPEAAIEAGALALFGEKYGDEVRVLTMGEGDCPMSVELCGGTHVKNTGVIGLFKITYEGSISSGVRRIEAVTGEAAVQAFRHKEELLAASAEKLKAASAEVPERIEALQKEVQKLKSDLKQAKKGGGAGGSSAADMAKKA